MDSFTTEPSGKPHIYAYCRPKNGPLTHANVFISKQERTTAVFVSAILLIVGVVLHNYFSPLAILYVFVPKTPVSWEDPSLTA